MKIRVKSLEKIVAICEAMHKRSRSASIANERIFYARMLFNKGMLHGRSLCLQLEPAKEGDEIDFPGIAALTRVLIESHNAFVYLTESGLTQCEREFRITLMQLNQSSDLLKITDTLIENKANPTLYFQKASKSHSINVLKNNSVFNSLSEKQRAHLLKGKSPYLMERYGGPRPVTKKLESAIYNLFSHNVHSYGLSASYSSHGAMTPAGFMNLLFLGVEAAIIFLAHLAKQYQNVRGRALGTMPKCDKNFIEETLLLTHINEWKNKLVYQM